jgi:hypothetical protein
MTTAKRKRAERALANHEGGSRFSVGDFVLMEDEPRAKLLPGLSKPFKIIQVLAGNTYRIQPVDDFRKESLIRTHHKLIRYQLPDPTLQSPEVATAYPPPKKRGRPRKVPSAVSGGTPAPHGSDDIPSVAEHEEIPEAEYPGEPEDALVDLSSEEDDVRFPRPKRGRAPIPAGDDDNSPGGRTPFKQLRIAESVSDQGDEMGADF